MANRKDDGFLPGYASHLSRYCTTCRDEIGFQVITKAKRCSNGHRVDLRDETDLDLGRCCYCDNLIRATYTYCGTCGRENNGHDAQKRVRLMKQREMKWLWRTRKELNNQARNFGLEVKVSDYAGLILQVPSPTVDGLLALPAAGESSSTSSSSSLYNEKLSQSSVPSSSSSGSSGIPRYNLRSSTFVPSSSNEQLELTTPARVIPKSASGGSVAKGPEQIGGELIQEIKQEPTDADDAAFLSVDTQEATSSSIEFLEEIKPPVSQEVDSKKLSLGTIENSDGVQSHGLLIEGGSKSSTPTSWKSEENRITRNKRPPSQKRRQSEQLSKRVEPEKDKVNDDVLIVTTEKFKTVVNKMRDENFKEN